MKKRKFWTIFSRICVGLLIVAGLILLLGLQGFSFSAYCCFGAAGLIIGYALIRLLGKNHKKGARILGTILTIFLCIGLLAALITGIFIARDARGDTTTQCDYLIVLGAGVNGTTPSLSLRERIDAAAAYLKEHPDTICVVSGGQGNGEDISEAACMYRELTALGIDPDRIWQEDRSTSTRENFTYSLDLIEEKTGTRPETSAVLSSEYHLFRAKLVAARQGLHMVGVPARSRWPALFVNYFLREIVAVWYYTIFGG